MTQSEGDAQARIYREDAEEYDALISAEDVDGCLVRELARRVPLDGARLVDVGAGTGRIARLLAASVAHVDLVEREAPMLAVAERRLRELGVSNFGTHLADARRMPLANASADVAIAGWVFGHFRSWMPDDWRLQVGTALCEMKRVVRPGGHRVVIETLGTGHQTPRHNAALDEYFACLEHEHCFVRSWIRTDYVFANVETAARTAGRFFGHAMAERIRAERWSRVPECTAIFVAGN
jgi:ubiquinone/menaquinone biosynthesis C-methylase UbiE